jgi:shikimate dehydrogenase
MINGKTHLYGVLGYPVHHSKSPIIHNYWYRVLGINGVYVPLPTAPTSLKQSLSALPALGFKGVNVTIPHKETVYQLCDSITDTAKAIGAVNTVVFSDTTILGHNTDGMGFMASLGKIESLEQCLNKVVLLGAGGAARAVVLALKQAGCVSLTLVNRTREKAHQLLPLCPNDTVIVSFDALDTAMEGATFVINATSLGMIEGTFPSLPWHTVSRGCIAYDIGYADTVTPFVASAKAAGIDAIEGLPMLVHQAAAAFWIWHKIHPPIDEGLWSLLA